MSKVPPTTKRWPELQRCNRDGYSLVMQGLATIVRIAQGEDSRQALAAGQWLVTYGEALIRDKRAEKLAAIGALPPPPETREQILSDLKGLYAKALGSSPLVVDAAPAPSDQT